LKPTCAEAGILGAVAGVMGTLQATEVLKEILGIGQTMAGRMLIYDALTGVMRQVKINPDPECSLCGPKATIRDLSLHS
jgi:adenylyltransferase/sulfurtransferase